MENSNYSCDQSPSASVYPSGSSPQAQPSPPSMTLLEAVNALNLVVLAPINSQVAVHPSGNGYVITAECGQLVMQAEQISGPQPSEPVVMACHAVPAFVTQLVEVETPGHHKQQEILPVPPPIAKPYTSFQCPVSGKWFLMYKQRDCPPYFTVGPHWK